MSGRWAGPLGLVALLAGGMASAAEATADGLPPPSPELLAPRGRAARDRRRSIRTSFCATRMGAPSGVGHAG